MFDHLVGEVTALAPARVVLRVAGIGFELKVPTTVSQRLQVGATACLYTVLHVADGQPTLLGFGTAAEREFGRMLMGVSGVGPSMSLAILSTWSIAEVAGAILAGEHQVLKRVKGVGARTAERLCLELRDRVAGMTFDGPGLVPPSVVLLPQSCEDAIAALVTLGFPLKEARTKVLRLHEAAPGTATPELITQVLRQG